MFIEYRKQIAMKKKNFDINYFQQQEILEKGCKMQKVNHVYLVKKLNVKILKKIKRKG